MEAHRKGSSVEGAKKTKSKKCKPKINFKEICRLQDLRYTFGVKSNFSIEML